MPPIVGIGESRTPNFDLEIPMPQATSNPPEDKTSKPVTVKIPGKPSAAPLTGSAFIRALPRTMPLEEVMDKAKKAGLSFSKDLVRKARTTDPLAATKTSKTKPKPAVKKARKPVSKPSRAAKAAKVNVVRGKPKKTSAAKPRPVAPPKPVAPVATRKVADLPTPEMVFVRLALDIGLQKAKDLLVAVDGKLAALVALI